MAARGTINELYDIQSLQGQQEAVLSFVKQYTEAVKSASQVKIKLGGAEGAKDIANGIKQLNAEQQKLADLQIKIAKAETEYARARLNSNKADTESIKTKKEQVALNEKLAKEQAKLITAAEKEAKSIEKANNEYIKLNDQYKIASAASLKRGAELLKEANGNELLYKSLLKTDKEYVATTKSASDYQRQLLMLEQNVGRSQRNVGNYASAFSGLNMSFAQVARELPSLTISFQQFALAISNNLPIAADEIARAKVEIARLKAEGQAAPTLFQTITKSILSFQVGLSILITAFVALAPQISAFISSMFDASKATLDATRAAKYYEQALESQDSQLEGLNRTLDEYIGLLTEVNSTRAGGDLDTLRAELQIIGEKKFAEIQYNKEVRKTYDEITKSINALAKAPTLNLTTGKETTGLEDVPKELIEQQKAYEKAIIDSEKRIKDERFKEQLVTVRIANQKKKDQDELNEKLKAAAEKLADLRKKLNDDELAAQRELIIFRLQNIADEQEAILNSEKHTFEERLNAANNFFDATSALFKEQEKQELADIDKKAKEAKLGEAAVQNQKALVRAKFGQKFIDLQKTIEDKIIDITKASVDKEEKIRLESFQKKLKAIEDAGSIEISQIQKQRDEELLALSERADATAMSFEEQQAERLQILSKYAKLELIAKLKQVNKLIALETDPVKRASLEAQAAAIRLKIDDDLTAEKIKNLKEIEAEERRLAEIQKQLQQEILNLVKSVALGRFDAEKNAIQVQIDKIEEQKRADIDAINATTLAATEKAARITNAEKKAQSEREKLQLKQKQLDRQRAQFEKAFNVAQIAINTIREVGKIKLAIAGHIATLNPAGAAIAASQIPIAIAIGAIQAAAALATPIPRFKTGKGQYDQYEGPAWVGDGGKSEMIFRENGAMEKTPATPVLTWVGKNDIIHPDANALMNHTIKKQGEVMNYSVPGDYAFDEMTSTLSNKLGRIEKAIMNKREYYFNINNGKPSVMTKDGNRTKQYLNDNLQFGK